MKQRMQGLVMGVLVTTLLLGTVTAFAATTQTIDVVFGNVRTTLFGQEFVAMDDQGTAVVPLTYNGRTYIPVEAILHAMGDGAQWDAATATLNFGAVVEDTPQLPEGRPLLEVAPSFERAGNATIRIQTATMRGETFTNAITVPTSANGWAHHALDGQFTRLTGTIGRIDGSGTVPRILRFIGDGNELASFTIGEHFAPEDISIDVTGVTTLRIEVVRTPGANAGLGVAFANAMLY